MGQTASELKTALQNAVKAASHKPYFFAMVIKGGVEGALFAGKRKVPTKLTDVAKKELGASTVVRGLCFGDSGKMVFETAKPGTSAMETMAKRLAQVQCGLTIKPEFRQGRDENSVDDIEDDDEPASGAAKASVATPVVAVAPEATPPKAKAAEQPSAAAQAKKAYDGLLERLQPQVQEARDAKSPAMAKIAPLLDFAADKAGGGDHLAAVKALQGLQAILDTPPVATVAAAKGSAAKPAAEPASTTVSPGSSKPADAESLAFNTHFATVAAKLKKAAEAALPTAAAAKAQLVQAGALAQKKDYEGATKLLAEAEKALESTSGGSSSKAPTQATTTSRERAPIEQDGARDFLAKIDPAEEQEKVTEATANLLHDMKTKLTQTKKMVTVKDVGELALKMSQESDTGLTPEGAAELIANNKGRGFTGRSGTVYVLGGTPEAAHDEVHESVHLMSAPGGATQIMGKYGEQLNEACTEYFTKQMCAKLNVPDAVSYPEHVAFMNQLVPVVGYNLIYTAYMKNGGFDPVINKLTDIWIAKSNDLLPAQKPPNVKGVITRAKVVEAMDKKFLNNFPPTGVAMKFWNAVFFA